MREFLSFGERLRNLTLFASLCLQDLILLVRPLGFGLGGLEKNFAARLVALHCYDITDKLLQLLGDNQLSKDGLDYCDPKTRSRLREASKEIAILRKQNLQHWDSIRNSCIGHRDKDAFEQLLIIENLDPDKLGKNAGKLCLIMGKIIQALIPEIAARMSRRQELFKRIRLVKRMVDGREAEGSQLV